MRRHGRAGELRLPRPDRQPDAEFDHPGPQSRQHAGPERQDRGADPGAPARTALRGRLYRGVPRLRRFQLCLGLRLHRRRREDRWLKESHSGATRKRRTRNPEVISARFSDVQLHIEVRANARPGMTRMYQHQTGLPIMPVTLDPDAAAVFKAFQEAGRPPYETLTPQEAREFYLAGRPVTNPEPPELKSVEPLSIPAPHGSIPARVYTPQAPRLSGGLAPCLVFFHGGGWVIGDLDSHDVVCRKLADEGELIVISVDYRLA